MRLWPRKRNANDREAVDIAGNVIDQVTYLMNYREHYDPIFQEAPELLTDKVLAELFLFRAWTTQFAYRMVADSRAHDALITETVSSCRYLGNKMFRHLHGFSIEEELASDLMDLIEGRWWLYDDVVIKSDKTLPSREICGQFTKQAGVHDPLALVRLAVDFVNHVEQVGKNAIANDLFEPGRKVKTLSGIESR